METLGYFLAVVMGMVLGLLGGGGSILTVPILVYFFGLPAAIATGYSLLVVGITSLVGSVKYYRERLIDFRIALLFAIPSMIGVLVSRKYLLPVLPDNMSVFSLGVTKDQVIMLFFAVLVLVISVFMFKAKEEDANKDSQASISKNKLYWIALEGFLVGVITGFVGAGGGFMIVPALMLLANVPLRKAIATSLVIISLKSLAGFVGDLSEGSQFDWYFLSVFVSITMIGVLLGTVLNKKMPVLVLRKGFAYFVFGMGLLIVVKELL
jgi:uncharacterized protein